MNHGYTYVGKHRARQSHTTRRVVTGMATATTALAGAGLHSATQAPEAEAAPSAQDVVATTNQAVGTARQAVGTAQQTVDTAQRVANTTNQAIGTAQHVANNTRTIVNDPTSAPQVLAPDAQRAFDAASQAVSSNGSGVPALPLAPNDLPLNPLSSQQRSIIVNTALAQLGKPYQWGGNGPLTFDCSGLIKYVYNRAGIQVPRIASAQATYGRPVISTAFLQPGDVVGYNGGGHIGLYLGNGKVIHAPHTGDVVRIADVSSMPIWRMSNIVG